MTEPGSPDFAGGEEALGVKENVLSILGIAVADGDHGTLTTVVKHQTAIEGISLARYADMQRSGHEENDPEYRSWTLALGTAIGTISETDRASLPDSELGWLVRISPSVEFELIMTNPDVGEEKVLPEMPPRKTPEVRTADLPDWRTDNFEIPLEAEKAEAVFNNPVFRRALNVLHAGEEERPFSERLYDAKEVIRNELGIEDRAPALLVLDSYVFDHAEALLRGDIVGNMPDTFMEAKETCYMASNDTVRRKMISALDKYVFDAAKDFLEGYVSGPSDDREKEAKLIINQYSSTIERRNAMLRELNLL